MKSDRSWISGFVNPTRINKKNIIKINENDKIIIKPQLLRGIRARNKEKDLQLLKKRLKKTI